MKKFIKLIKELYKTPKGKAALFFGGYVLFFIFLMIFVRVITPDTTSSEDFEAGNPYDYSISNLVSLNYNYTYTITCDNKKYEYNGKSDGEEEIFIYDGVDYYRNSDGFYNNKSGSFVKGNNPFQQYYFLQLDNINDLFSKAYYVSKTEYDDARQEYKYLISTNTIIKLMDDKDIDISDDANNLTLGTDTDGYVNRLEFGLDSFAKYKKVCNGKLNIILNYKDYGNIDKIKSPLN